MADPTCPCGESHVGHTWDIAVRLTRSMGLTVEVKTPDGAWHVPRVYIAMHGILALHLPALAAKYGWKRVGSELN